MYIPQIQLENIRKSITPNKAIVLYGARRTGKTTLINHFINSLEENYLLLNCDDVLVKEYLESQSIDKLKSLIKGNKYLIIDEAQNIKNIGINLKLIVDHINGIYVIAAGSSSFDLANKIGEPLTGRKFNFLLYPLSQIELSAKENLIQTNANLESRLIFGSYPEVILADNIKKKILILKEITILEECHFK